MQADPVLEWRRLTAHYRELSDDGLRELAADFADLTDAAKQVLRNEMQSRGLSDPQAPAPMPQRNAHSAVEHIDGVPTNVFSRAPQMVRDEPADDAGGDESEFQYTWKTDLCECETLEQAQELSVALQRAGLDNWIQPSREFGRRYARVLVAADQLEQARAIAATPIPQEILDHSKQEVPEFVAPVCPQCGAADPILESVEPANTWRCELCDAEWSDAPGGNRERNSALSGETP
jgi:hypothetical protein